MKQIIFIAGTAYSGSSMLDMMLGNTDSSFSIGEAQYFFKPTKAYHISPKCGCGESSCDLWKNLKKFGEYEFYNKIFENFNYINTIIDSSKDPFWIHSHQKYLSNQGFLTKIIIIWKSPEEFRYSRFKRDSPYGWDRAWINYHKLFFSLNMDWRSVQYCELAKSPAETLKKLCQYLSIPYSESIIEFWNKKHHMLFGNLSAKFHTFDKNAMNYKKTVENLSSIERKHASNSDEIENKHRKIFYDTPFNDKIDDSIPPSKKYIFDTIIKFLNFRSIYNAEILPNSYTKTPTLSKPIIWLYHAKRLLLCLIFSFCYLITKIRKSK